MSPAFSEEEYHRKTFEKLSLAEESARGIVFDRCVFRGCEFSSCDFSGSEFSECRFEQCVLSLTKFLNCALKSVTFRNSKLVGIDLTKCSGKFLRLEFFDSLIELCNFSTLPMMRTLFETCTIRDCTFGGTDLTKALFMRCDLAGTIFHGTKLLGTDFTTSRNYAINPVGNAIKGARFALPEAVSLLRAFDIKLE
jgi:uncharacterized protein YjbI with pentapeptide repeats